MNSLEEIALKVAREVSPDGWLCGDDPVGEFARRLVAVLGAQEPVAYLHYAAKKPSLRELSFSAEPNALQIAAGWKSKPLFAAAPSPQEDKT